jgi:hypothetical protein
MARDGGRPVSAPGDDSRRQPRGNVEDADAFETSSTTTDL